MENATIAGTDGEFRTFRSFKKLSDSGNLSENWNRKIKAKGNLYAPMKWYME